MSARSEDARGKSLVASIAKYTAIFRIELRQQTAYAGDFILSNITVVLFFYVLLQVWKLTVSKGGVAALPGESFTWEELIWFLAASQTLYFAVQTEAQLYIEHDVISGNIAITLARPYDYLLGRMAAVAANTLLSFAVAFPAAFIMAWIASGKIAVGITGVLAFFLGFVLRSILFFALQAIAGLATFWIERATAFVWITGLMILIFGGGAVPLGYWPPWAQTIANLTPFPAMMYYPSRVFVRPDAASVGSMVVHCVVWIGILGGIVVAIYGRALRRLDLNGG